MKIVKIGTRNGTDIFATDEGNIIYRDGTQLPYTRHDNTYNFLLDNPTNGKVIRRNVASYIANSFIPNPYKVTRVTFKDNDGFNTHPSNISWADKAKRIAENSNLGYITLAGIKELKCKPSYVPEIGDNLMVSPKGKLYTKTTKGYKERKIGTDSIHSVRCVIKGESYYTSVSMELLNLFNIKPIFNTSKHDFIPMVKTDRDSIKETLYECHRFIKAFGVIYVTKSLRFFVYFNNDFYEVFSKVGNINEKEYPFLSINRVYGRIRTHLVVGEALVTKPKFIKGETYVVNHIDGDKTNYEPSNLEWITQKENMVHAIKEGLRVGYTPEERDKVYTFMNNANSCSNSGVAHCTGVTVSYIKDLRKKPRWAPERAKYPNIYYGRERFTLSDFEANEIKKLLIEDELELSVIGKFFKGKLVKISDKEFLFTNPVNSLTIEL